MRFAPEYVTNVLNENFEDAKAAAPGAADGDSLRPPGDAGRAGHRLARPTRARCATRSTASRSTSVRDVPYDGTCEDLFFYIERLIVEAVRRRRRRPAAHGAQPQRHRHDDVPDAAARVHRSRWPAATLELRAALLELADRHRDTVFAAHTHTQPAQPTTIAHYLLAVIEQLERDTDAARRPPTIAPIAIRSAPAPSPAPAFRSIATSPASCSASDGPTGNTYGSIATVDYLLESVVGHGRAAGRARPRRAGPAAVVHDGVRLPAARRRLRAVEQHHAAEAQSGGARARARHRQQGASARRRRSSPPSTTRRSATSSTPRTICSRWWRRCSAMPPAR